MIKYCSLCVMPSTRPGLELNDSGVCNACTAFQNRKCIDWHQRHLELQSLLSQYRGNSRSCWDCVIPVSGGKDSFFQVVKMLELGMRPLCVTATTCDLTPLGRKNLTRLKEIGVDHLEFTLNPQVRKTLNRNSLRKLGDISWPEHVAIFTLPVRISVRFDIPLIIWGENSQNEYGGPAADGNNPVLSRTWLETYGGMLGTSVMDWVGVDGITEQDMVPYLYPRDEDLQKAGTTGLFLGHYLPWDGLTNTLIAQSVGFESSSDCCNGTMSNVESLDNHHSGIHEYFKFLKFGYSRASDQASLHVRRSRLSRSEAINIVRLRDGKYPWEYLGKSLPNILTDLGVGLDEFNVICDKFTNRSIFVTDLNGDYLRTSDFSLVKTNYDNQ
jgi:N-acetyl sugar amidotransferase